MVDTLSFSSVFPVVPDESTRLFFVGIGGIGMSGLAQFLCQRGYKIAGSDRGIDDEAKKDLYDSLRRIGIALYPQDGSGPRDFKPTGFVASAAIEPGNADIAECPDLPVFHRATALAAALAALKCPRISIAGSCGKTSVTGWIAAALKHLGYSIAMVNGGYTLDFEDDTHPGNFYMDPQPQIAVAEVDESDRSIREFSQEYAVLLNVGNDHYEKEELNQVFGNYLERTSGAVIVLDELKNLAINHAACPVRTFGTPQNYASSQNGISFFQEEFGTMNATQSGRHSALNAMAVMNVLAAVCPERTLEERQQALAAFQGVRQRFEIMPSQSIPCINDYAHNPEKIQAAIETARERFGGPVLAFFQPHGFGPLKFMRAPLVDMLERVLHPDDTFAFLPVFYAGGTTGFSPSSAEVAAEAAQRKLPVVALESREEAEILLTRKNKFPACVLVLGARDASLRPWTRKLASL